MEKEQVHVCSVFTREFPPGMKEQIKRSLFEAGYKLHNFQSVGSLSIGIATTRPKFVSCSTKK